jgi:hypothetical protein
MNFRGGPLQRHPKLNGLHPRQIFVRALTAAAIQRLRRKIETLRLNGLMARETNAISPFRNSRQRIVDLRHFGQVPLSQAVKQLDSALVRGMIEPIFVFIDRLLFALKMLARHYDFIAALYQSVVMRLIMGVVH